MILPGCSCSSALEHFCLYKSSYVLVDCLTYSPLGTQCSISPLSPSQLLPIIVITLILPLINKCNIQPLMFPNTIIHIVPLTAGKPVSQQHILPSTLATEDRHTEILSNVSVLLINQFLIDPVESLLFFSHSLKIIQLVGSLVSHNNTLVCPLL